MLDTAMNKTMTEVVSKYSLPKLIEMLIEKGTSTALAAVLLWAFWVAVLQPQARERVIMINLLRENSKHTVESMAENKKSQQATAENSTLIADSVYKQSATLKAIHDEIVNQTELRKVAMTTMTAFADEMREINPSNGKKLDELIDVAKEDDHKEKLERILQEIEALQELIRSEREP